MPFELRFFNTLSTEENEWVTKANQAAIGSGLLANVKLAKDLYKPKSRLYLSMAELNAQCKAKLVQYEDNSWLWWDTLDTPLHGLFKYVYFNNSFYVYQQGNKALDKLFKHCSLACGLPVEMSGSVLINDGQLLEITNDSGHYPSNQGSFSIFIDKIKHLYPGLVDDFVQDDSPTYTCLCRPYPNNEAYRSYI